jgi:hypothetical protein
VPRRGYQHRVSHTKLLVAPAACASHRPAQILRACQVKAQQSVMLLVICKPNVLRYTRGVFVRSRNTRAFSSSSRKDVVIELGRVWTAKQLVRRLCNYLSVYKQVAHFAKGCRPRRYLLTDPWLSTWQMPEMAGCLWPSICC